jgi:hypothetical protein
METILNINHYYDRLAMWLAWRLPRRVAMWAFYRISAYAWADMGDKCPDEISIMDAVKTWPC